MGSRIHYFTFRSPVDSWEVLQGTYFLELGLVKLRGISPLLLGDGPALHLLEDGLVVDVSWRPHGQGVPPSLGELVDAVDLVIEVDVFVLGSGRWLDWFRLRTRFRPFLNIRSRGAYFKFSRSVIMLVLDLLISFLLLKLLFLFKLFKLLLFLQQTLKLIQLFFQVILLL